MDYDPSESDCEGKVGNSILIRNFINVDNKDRKSFEFYLEGIIDFTTTTVTSLENPISVYAAGIWSLQTMQRFGDHYYAVDFGSNESFTPIEGAINAVAAPLGIVINKPKNSIKDDVVYTLNFIVEDAVPKNGFIKVVMPDEIKLQVASTLSTGSCRDSRLTCGESQYTTESTVVFGPF